MSKTIVVKCPQCDLTFNYYDEPTRPFCSKRCQQIDLGHWFQESYKVESEKKVEIINDPKNEDEISEEKKEKLKEKLKEEHNEEVDESSEYH